MKVAIFSRTPLAAAPFELWKSLKKYTTIEAALVNSSLRYNDGRVFPGHLQWPTPLAEAAMREAEVWHIHNYLIDALPKIKNGQGVMAQFHSLPRLGNWACLMAFANKNYTIRQPGQIAEYKLPALPNIIDPDEYRPERRRDARVTIGFAPTSHAPVGHPASKGYSEVLVILAAVAAVRDVEICLIENRPYTVNLKMKSNCHILVDDVVTGNWHRTSLEGACFGCAVVNKNRTMPFVHASLSNLKDRLLWLIDNPNILASVQEQSRVWVESEWHGMDLVQDYAKVYKEMAAYANH
jgi:hypothetical protein